MIEAVFPASVGRAAGRVGMIAIVLGIFAVVFFPVSIVAGTETEVQRWITALALIVAGAVLKYAAKRLLPALVVLGALAVAGALIPAWWIAVFALGGAAYLVLTLYPRTTPLSATEMAESPEIPPAEVLRENVEAIAMALVLALTVRQFAVEAFVIPTGSMKPTIMGQGDEGGVRTPGDRLLAWKFPVYDDSLERWSIVVFHYPLFRPTNYIKRLIGLPGEKLEIRNGDIYVNDEIAAKPDVVQESLWLPEFPQGLGGTVSRFDQVFEADAVGTWEIREDEADVRVEGDSISWLRFDGHLQDSNDRRVAFDIDVASLGANGAVIARLDSERRRVELKLSAAGVFITAPGIERERVDLPAIRAGSVQRIGLGVADRVIRVYVDGHQRVKLTHPDETNRTLDDREVVLGVRDAAVTLGGVTIDRDLHYTGRHRWDIPADCFIALGDNTTASEDSRRWRGNVITTNDGHTYVAATSARIGDGPKRTNFRQVDGKYVFLDRFGVPREIPMDEATVSSEALPYVHREDMIGRAFFIFYPFPPFGSFRPRFLP